MEDKNMDENSTDAVTMDELQELTKGKRRPGHFGIFAVDGDNKGEIINQETFEVYHGLKEWNKARNGRAASLIVTWRCVPTKE